MSNEVSYKQLIAFHPGSYVEEIVDELNITQNEFAERLGTSSKTLSKIINGEEKISADVANKLAKATGVSIKTWLNLQVAYDAKVMEIKDLQDEDEKRACELIDFSYFKNNGFVEDRRYSVKEKIKELRKLLNLSNLSMLYEFNNAVSYRNTREFEEKSIVNSNVMLELAIDIARSGTDVKYDKRKLEKCLPEIRKMTLESPEKFYPKLKEMLLDCGIVLVGLPKLKNANLNGATKKFKNGSVLLLITDRNKKSDIFWFSLIHELGHIYHKDFYTDYQDIEKYKEKEKQADIFAQDFFIPREQYDRFVDVGSFTEASIVGFAKDVQISPSILIGRLENDGFVQHSEYSHLKPSYSVCLSSQ